MPGLEVGPWGLFRAPKGERGWGGATRALMVLLNQLEALERRTLGWVGKVGWPVLPHLGLK